METGIRCAACGRQDFAGGRRCPYCAEPLPEAKVGAEAHQGADGQAPAGNRSSQAAGVAAGVLACSLKSVVWSALKMACTTGLSMLVMMCWQASRHGWWFGVSFVALAFVHEMGHVWMLRRQGIPASAPVFIPFVGAIIGMKRMPADAAAEAAVGIGGPAVGTAASVLCLAAYTVTGWAVLLPAAFFGFLLNLVNLLPVSPLDGGRIVAAVSPRIWWLGLPLLFALAWFTHSIILWIVLLAGIARALTAHKSKEYFRVPAATRRLFGAAYLGMVVTAGGLCYGTYVVGTRTGVWDALERTAGKGTNKPLMAAGVWWSRARQDASNFLALPPRAAAETVSGLAHALPSGVRWGMVAWSAGMLAVAWILVGVGLWIGAGRPAGWRGWVYPGAGAFWGVATVAAVIAGSAAAFPALVAYLGLLLGIALSARGSASRWFRRGAITPRRAAARGGAFRGLLILLVIANLWGILTVGPTIALLIIGLVIYDRSMRVEARATLMGMGDPEEGLRMREDALRSPWLPLFSRVTLSEDAVRTCLGMGQFERGIGHAQTMLRQLGNSRSFGLKVRVLLAGALIETGRYAEAVEQVSVVYAAEALLSGQRAFATWRNHGDRLMAHLSIRRGLPEDALLYAGRVLDAAAGFDEEEMLGAGDTEKDAMGQDTGLCAALQGRRRVLPPVPGADPTRPGDYWAERRGRTAYARRMGLMRSAHAAETGAEVVVAHWCRAEALRQTGDLETAAGACEAGLTICSTMGGFWRSHLLSARAAVRCAEGHWEEALSDADGALRAFDRNVDAHFWLARALWATGRGAEAAAALREGANLNPGHAYAQRCAAALRGPSR